MDTLCVYVGGPHPTLILKGKLTHSKQVSISEVTVLVRASASTAPACVMLVLPGLRQPPWGGPSLSTAGATQHLSRQTLSPLYFLICLCIHMYVYGCTRATVCVERPETTCETQFHPSLCGFWLGVKHPYSLGHLSGLDDFLVYIEINL